MAFEVKNKTGESVLKSDHLPAEAGAFRAEQLDLALPFGRVKASQWYFDGIKVTSSESLFNEPLTLDWKGDTEVVTMHFNLQGRVSMQHPGMEQTFVLRGNQHNLFYGKEAEGKMKVDDLKLRTFLVQFSKEAFFNIAGEGNDAIKRFADQVAGGRPVAFSEHNLNIDLNIQHCIQAMQHCRYNDSLKRMYFLSKSIELLVLQAESFNRALQPRSLYVKSDYDRERILFVRDYLLQHIGQPPTLVELARIAGINEYKLKRGFKEAFNQTVFEYLSDVRLELARKELLEKKKTATQIAFELGYSSLQHFSAAFKKKYHTSPARVL